MIVRPRAELWEHVCEICNASWIGYGDDDCYWCDKRVSNELESRRNRLLFPEWLSWAEQRLFIESNEITRAVWAETRGFTGDYRGKWERDLLKALSAGTITAHEATDALRRFDRWVTNMRNYGNS